MLYPDSNGHLPRPCLYISTTACITIAIMVSCIGKSWIVTSMLHVGEVPVCVTLLVPTCSKERWQQAAIWNRRRFSDIFLRFHDSAFSTSISLSPPCSRVYNHRSVHCYGPYRFDLFNLWLYRSSDTKNDWGKSKNNNSRQSSNEGIKGVPLRGMNPATKRHLELQIETLQNATRDPEKSELIFKTLF